MYTLHIGKSSSPNYQKAIDWLKLAGATKKGDDWVLEIKHEIKAYRAMFPLFRLNAMTWKNTRAYVNGKPVNPYRFLLKTHLSNNAFIEDVLGQITHEQKPYLYHKREGNTFYFKDTQISFELKLSGKELYSFVDQYDIGDIVYY